jgi:hypothetical protein
LQIWKFKRLKIGNYLKIINDLRLKTSFTSKFFYAGARSIFKQLFFSLSPIRIFRVFFPTSLLLLPVILRFNKKTIRGDWSGKQTLFENAHRSKSIQTLVSNWTLLGFLDMVKLFLTGKVQFLCPCLYEQFLTALKFLTELIWQKQWTCNINIFMHVMNSELC